VGHRPLGGTLININKYGFSLLAGIVKARKHDCVPPRSSHHLTMTL
jgi:hypothetical protein